MNTSDIFNEKLASQLSVVSPLTFGMREWRVTMVESRDNVEERQEGGERGQWRGEGRGSSLVSGDQEEVGSGSFAATGECRCIWQSAAEHVKPSPEA